MYLQLINRLSKVTELYIMETICYRLVYPLLSYEDILTVNQLLQAVSSITNYLFTWKKVRNNCLFKRRL